MVLRDAFVFAVLAGSTLALPHASVKRQVSHLRDSYDFVIAGGGTAGLVVANRLTEAFPNSECPSIPDLVHGHLKSGAETVLVVEYGDVEFAAGIFDPPAAVWGTNGAMASRWTVQSLPNPEVRNKKADAAAGKVVGGSSAINGMFFDRPSRWDHEAWKQVSSPDWDDHRDQWDWDGIFPFFKKVRSSLR